MANIRQFKKKIKSAKNIAKITKAMQMVAASKMKRAQDLAKSSRDYSDGIEDFSASISNSSKISEEVHPLLSIKPRKDLGKELVLYIAPEKGLCGGLLSNLYRFVESGLQVSQKIKSLSFVVIGKKAKNHVVRMGGNIVAEFSIGFSQPSYESIPAIARYVREEFLKGEVSRVSVIYERFINTLEQEPVIKTILPLNLVEIERKGETTGENDDSFLFEPSSGEIASLLLDRYLEVELYQLVLEGYASEQSARMIAMKNATDNAKGIIEELTMGYNKERQSSITSEISDISSTMYTQE